MRVSVEKTQPIVPSTKTRKRKKFRSYSSFSDTMLTAVLFCIADVFVPRIVLPMAFKQVLGVSAEAVGSPVASTAVPWLEEDEGEDVVVVRGFR